MKRKADQRKIRHARLRAKIKGTGVRPRLSVFRSSQHIYAQLINDEIGKTLVSFNDLKLKEKKISKKAAIAKQVGMNLAKQALEKKIKKAVFDRGGYKYHGRIKAVAEGAREGGLEF